MGHLPSFLIDCQIWKVIQHPQTAKLARSVNISQQCNSIGHLGSSVVSIDSVLESVVDMAFSIAAHDLNLPVYGSCQGAHIAWLAKGEELVKWDKYTLPTVPTSKLAI